MEMEASVWQAWSTLDEMVCRGGEGAIDDEILRFERDWCIIEGVRRS